MRGGSVTRWPRAGADADGTATTLQDHVAHYAFLTRTVENPSRGLMRFGPRREAQPPEATPMSIDLILGAITACIVLVYLLAVLARPERY